MKIDTRHCNAYSGTGSKYFFRNKYVAISRRAGEHAGERILLLSASCRSYRQKRDVCVRKQARTGKRNQAHPNHRRRNSGIPTANNQVVKETKGREEEGRQQKGGKAKMPNAKKAHKKSRRNAKKNFQNRQAG